MKSPDSTLRMTRLAQIERELARAQDALREGNDGMVRVCARRAVGLAAEAWLERVPGKNWRGDALNHLRRVSAEESFPQDIRRAAERLMPKVTQRDTAPFSTDPIADARSIIAHLDARTYRAGA
jgi:HEPN domain-containing protein